ncbi:4Fe-4S double cluster binding domain-containing protein [uncultured Roseobacter sp.]|uniref:4Fe-4S double cluster binding domain-containing protein n=1 Tax=uncultured Roseobacter sp. TaxID=114847 RepID=UPI00261E6806|nr:4Fe-4S double cluster binding domain-containing protein [uncultured Roseobacter sp.]
MSPKFFSAAGRAPHLGSYPMEKCARGSRPDLKAVPVMPPVSFHRPQDPQSIVNAMADYQATMDALRDGLVNRSRATIPDDPGERSDHLKSFGYFCDASVVGIGPLPASARLKDPWRNPDIDRLAGELTTRQTKTLASGIDVILADLRDSMLAPATTATDHTTVLTFLCEWQRDPAPGEPGTDWLQNAQEQRAAMRSAEIAVVLASYIRLLGWDARAHTATSTDIDLNQATVAAGLAVAQNGMLLNPFLGDRFGVACVSTTMPLRHDRPLAPAALENAGGLAWRFGVGTSRSARNRDPFAHRDFRDGPHPFETLRRREAPTTYIDEARVARVPKRADMFARAQFGDMGKAVQDGASGGHYARKAAPSMAQRRMLGALTLLQDGPSGDGDRPSDAQRNADNIKAACYFLGIDATGLSRCPEWAWYSHDATGQPINPPHDQAISMIVDQGFDTMEGASGDDWISVAQSMRAYLRFSLLGGVIARQIRNLGYKAKAHTVMDGEVLQPPLLLLSGLGEVSRIGEVILNPFLGPRLKSGVVTTDMPMAHDRPIDFGLQRFCESCNKCARECPSGAITAGPKRMFNGYEIWKSDSQKCATYRITTAGGSMCGRCMKTCPWNLEGLFAEKPFRWAAMKIPAAAPVLARLDDRLGRGGLNPVKKWWWDIELADDGGYHPARNPVNARELQPDLKLRFEDQTLAVYPAPLAPPPAPYPFPMDREAGIRAYQDMISADDYRARRAAGDTGPWDHRYTANRESPVVEVKLAEVRALTDRVSLYAFEAADGADLPAWTAGAHLDIVISPDKLRQYSLCGDPADRKQYEIAVLREETGRGGSVLLHRIFRPGRRVFVAKPANHFPLEPAATAYILMGGGIGVTPMIAMAHELAARGQKFELHYSVSDTGDAAFASDLAAVHWADRVHLHVSAQGTRAELDTVFAAAAPGTHVYTCGPDSYMSAVVEAAQKAGVPEEACHIEYFTVPDTPEYENHPFHLQLRDGRVLDVPPEASAAQVLIDAGVPVDLKCADGLCGVCRCGLLGGDVEHRDFVLSKAQREQSIILCQSRAAEKNGTLLLDL